MAIFWCDPYLNSTNGGINGTVAKGTGSYTNPFDFVDICNSTTMSAALTAGDELRLKGLPEDTFYSVTPSGNLVEQSNSYTLPSGANNQSFRVTSDTGVYYYGASGSSGNGIAKSGGYYNSWTITFPPLQLNSLKLFNSAYYVSTTSMNILNGVGKKILVTAGWVSETENTGVTVIIPLGHSSYLNINVGTDQYTKFDTPNLILQISPATSTNYSATFNLYGYNSTFKSIYSYYNPGYNGSIFTTGNLRVTNNLSWGGYLRFFPTNPGAINSTIKPEILGYEWELYHLSGWYCNSSITTYFYADSSYASQTPSAVPGFKLKLKELGGWSAYSPNVFNPSYQNGTPQSGLTYSNSSIELVEGYRWFKYQSGGMAPIVAQYGYVPIRNATANNTNFTVLDSNTFVNSFVGTVSSFGNYLSYPYQLGQMGLASLSTNVFADAIQFAGYSYQPAYVRAASISPTQPIYNQYSHSDNSFAYPVIIYKDDSLKEEFQLIYPLAANTVCAYSSVDSSNRLIIQRPAPAAAVTPTSVGTGYRIGDILSEKIIAPNRLGVNLDIDVIDNSANVTVTVLIQRYTATGGSTIKTVTIAPSNNKITYGDVISVANPYVKVWAEIKINCVNNNSFKLQLNRFAFKEVVV